jgi:SAM-dependent methyltransferase
MINAIAGETNAAGAVARWARLIRANREQMGRLRDRDESPAAHAEHAEHHRPGHGRAPEFAVLRALLRPDDLWLDVGAGAGRLSIPISEVVAMVIALEPSEPMRDVLVETIRMTGRENVHVLADSWPSVRPLSFAGADVVLAAHVVYDVEDLQPFITSMEAAAGQFCVAILTDRAPSTPHLDVWQEITGEPYQELPALHEFEAVLGALGRSVTVDSSPVPPHDPETLDQLLPAVRRHYGASAGSPLDHRLAAALRRRTDHAGVVQIAPRFGRFAVVRWTK